MENWKYLNENYKVSDLGNVFSVRNSTILKLDNRGGYKRIKINIGNGIKKYGVHQLVAMAFLGHKPDGHKIVVDHINGNKSDNRLKNLRLVTGRANLSMRGGTSKYVGVYKQQNSWIAKITVDYKVEYLGSYKTEEEARTHYVKRLNELYPLY